MGPWCLGGWLGVVSSGCLYFPRPRNDMNRPPNIVSPAVEPAIFPMVGPSNYAAVVAIDPDGDRMYAIWSVPTVPPPYNTETYDDGDLTTFVIFLPRIEALHGRTVTVTLVDDDPDDSQRATFDFLVQVQ